MSELKEPTSYSKIDRPPLLDMIVGEAVGLDKKKELTDFLLDQFKEQDMDWIKEGIVELTPEQRALIVEANRLTNEAIKRLGFESRIDLDPAHVHLVSPDLFEDAIHRSGGLAGGTAADVRAFASLAQQAIFIKAEKENDLRFLNRIMHEMLHLKSFISLQMVEEKGADDYFVVDRRFGILMREAEKGGKTFFFDLNEAITELIVVYAVRGLDLGVNPELKQSFKRSEELRTKLLEYLEPILRQLKSPEDMEHGLKFIEAYVILRLESVLLPEAETFLDKMEHMSDKNSVLDEAVDFYLEHENDPELPKFGYVKPRLMLEKLIAKILVLNLGSLNTSDDVFKLFTQAYFEGRLLPLARIVDKTFGKDAFRRLGEGEDLMHLTSTPK